MRQVIGDLKRVRRISRLMLILQRIAVLIAWTLGVVLALVAGDWLLRLPGTVRLFLLAGAATGLTIAVIRYLRPAIQFWPSLTQVALRAEESLPRVSGRLASGVEFAMTGAADENALAARSVKDAEQRLAGESLMKVMQPRRTMRDVLVMAVVVLAVAGLAYSYPQAAKTGLSRLLLPYGETAWPARTGVDSLMHDQVPASRVHPRGRMLTFSAKVTKGAEDQDVEARYRLKREGEFGDWQEVILTHQSDGVHQRKIETAAEAIELYFVTEDSQTKMERIELVAEPAVIRAGLSVTPPSYAAGLYPPLNAELGQGLDRRAETDVPSLMGSEVTLTLKLNKPLPVPAGGEREAWLTNTFNWNEGDLPTFRAAGESSDEWVLDWRLDRTRHLNLALQDEYGLRNAERIEFRIHAIEDRLPSVTITQPEGDEAVTATAVVPLAADARDDVAISRLGLEATIHQSDQVEPDVDAAWSSDESHSENAGTIQRDLDLSTLNVEEGDSVLIVGVADDMFELDGALHETVRSPARRLRIISELDFARDLRQQLNAVRQSAIRIEAMQAELQDDVAREGVQPGVARAQASVMERIAQQRETLDDVERRADANRLDDDQLRSMLEHASEMLDFAGRASNRAAGAINQRQAEQAQTGGPPESPEPPEPPESPKPPQTPGSQDSESQDGQDSQDEQQDPQDRTDEPTDDEQEDPFNIDDLNVREPAEEDREIFDAQQEVREELTDLIKLLDRNQDMWVAEQQVKKLLEEQSRLAAETARMGRETLGKTRDELTVDQRTELDEIAQRQRDLAEEVAPLLDDMRNRADQLEEVDSQSAEAIRAAADEAERSELERDMQNAADQVDENRMQNARGAQESAREKLEKMLDEMQNMKRARVEQLQRQLDSLIASIERLITVQENEISSLAESVHDSDFSGRDRAMIRLNQNTVAVAAEARAAGSEAREVARALDRAGNAQGDAIAALRARPINSGEAVAAEDRSIELLNEAMALAEALQQQLEEEQVREEREELLKSYRALAEREVALRGRTLELAQLAELDRRALVEARRQGNLQEAIRNELDGLRQTVAEHAESAVFDHAHQLMDTWATMVTEQLRDGEVGIDVTDREQMIADALGRTIKALEDSFALPPEFADQQSQQNGGGQGGQQGGEQQVIPDLAQLQLLRGLQEQVYDQTRSMDSRTDLDGGQLRERLRELGGMQRDLMDIGRQMLEELGAGSSPPAPMPPDGGDQPTEASDEE